MDWFGGTRNGCSQDTTNGWNGRQDRGPLLGRHVVVVFFHARRSRWEPHLGISARPRNHQPTRKERVEWIGFRRDWAIPAAPATSVGHNRSIIEITTHIEPPFYVKAKIYPYISQENGFWYLNLTTSLDANNEWDFKIEYSLNTAREVRLPNIENFLATFIHLSATYTTSEIWVKATNIWVITSELCDITFRVRFFTSRPKIL